MSNTNKRSWTEKCIHTNLDNVTYAKTGKPTGYKYCPECDEHFYPLSSLSQDTQEEVHVQISERPCPKCGSLIPEGIGCNCKSSPTEVPELEDTDFISIQDFPIQGYKEALPTVLTRKGAEKLQRIVNTLSKGEK